MVFPMVMCNTIQYHWTIQWYFSSLNGTGLFNGISVGLNGTVNGNS